MITGRAVSSRTKFYCSEKTLPKNEWAGYIRGKSVYKEVGLKPCPREGYLVFKPKNGKEEYKLVCFSHYERLSKK